MNFDDFKHRIGDHSAQEGADYLKFNQLGTQRRMAVMRGFEAYRMKKAEEVGGWGGGGEKYSHKRPEALQSWPRGFVGAWRPHKNRERSEGRSSEPQQVGSAGCGECRSISVMEGGGRKKNRGGEGGGGQGRGQK